jgi:transposase-like protein
MGLHFYSSFMKNTSKDKHFSFRKALVQEAFESGIKPAARRFGSSKTTVKLWMKRFQLTLRKTCKNRLIKYIVWM